MRATKTLPAGYELRGTFSVSTPKTMIGLNIVGAILLVVWVMFFLRIAVWLRPEMGTVMEIRIGLPQILLLFTLPIASIVLHELVHGFFLWLFTRERPRFGFKWLFAYASSPGWYIPRNQYIVVALAPFVLITLVGIGCLMLLPQPTILPLVLILATNAAGAIGDLAITGWIFTRPPVTYVSETDSLDATIY
jgi:hypothetical protein